MISPRHDMCACINGIICLGCLFTGLHGFVLWNLVIKQYKIFPYPTLPDFLVDIQQKVTSNIIKLLNYLLKINKKSLKFY